MKTIQVYDPPMCCSTGLCGNDIDPALVSFAALLTQVEPEGREGGALQPGPAADGVRAESDRQGVARTRKAWTRCR